MTAISNETISQLENEFPGIRGKVDLVPNCVDKAFEANYRADAASAVLPRVLQVGTGWNKNLERVAMAVSGLPIRLRIIGNVSAAQRRMLDSSGADWSSAEALPSIDLINEYLTSGMLIFVSTYEGFGLPIIEAQALGLPVITSDAEPMRETSGGAALLVDPLSVEQIRSAVRSLSSRPDLVRTLRAQGRSNAQRFSVAAVARRYAELYYRVLAG